MLCLFRWSPGTEAQYLYLVCSSAPIQVVAQQATHFLTGPPSASTTIHFLDSTGPSFLHCCNRFSLKLHINMLQQHPYANQNFYSQAGSFQICPCGQLDCMHCHAREETPLLLWREGRQQARDGITSKPPGPLFCSLPPTLACIFSYNIAGSNNTNYCHCCATMVSNIHLRSQHTA